MKKQKIQDERVLSLTRKVNSEAFALLWFALLASILVQEFLFTAPFSQYAAEFICFMGASVYLLVRNLMVGNNLLSSAQKSTKIIIIRASVTGLVVALVNGFSRYNEYRENIGGNMGIFIISVVVTFLSAAIAVFAVFYIIRQINEKRQKQVEKTLDDDA